MGGRRLAGLARSLRTSVLAALSVLAYFSCSEQAPEQDHGAQARSDLAQLVEALDAYHAVHGEWPETLTPLVRPDSEGRHFLTAGTSATYDPWGHAYEYERSGSSYTLVCLGSDGARGGSGTAADLSAG